MNMAKLKGSTKFGEVAVGTPPYVSLSAVEGIIEEKDDMVALGFCMCHLYGNQLPWITNKTLSMNTSEQFTAMQEIKEKTVIKDWVSISAFLLYYNCLCN